jgi:FAD/FMN-containing dehydrogenase
MTTTRTIAHPGLGAAADLRALMRGAVVAPAEAGYDRLRRVWNGAVDNYPAVIALCETVADVQAAMRFAREHELPLSVRGGGHDWAGRSMRDKSLVIDLSAMRRIEVDARTQVATVAGGATARELIAAVAPHGLVAVTGNCGAVGMAGLSLGGGYGLLSSRYGLAADNLLGAELVLADGERVTASASENAELFWALCGGGGNFGVVTSLRIRLHPVRELLAGLILFRWAEAEAVLQGFAEAMASAPDELGAIAGVLSGPDGAPAVFVAPAWSGDRDEGAPFMAALECLGTPLMTGIAPMTYADVLQMFDAHIVDGRRYAIQTRWMAALSPGVVSKLIAASDGRTSPLTMIGLHHMHGAASRIPPNATPFGLRGEHFLVELVAAWEASAEDDGGAHRRWARDCSSMLAANALPGGYPNLLGPEEHDQIAHAYGDNAGRLLAVKRRFDPDHVFAAIPLPI